MDGQTVKVQVLTQLYQDNGDDRYEIEAQGQFVHKPQADYVTYIEELPEQEPVQVRFKITQDKVTLTRRSASLQNRLVFDLRQPVSQTYLTAFGSMTMTTSTNKLAASIDANDGRGSLRLHYALQAQQGVIGQYQVFLQFA
ncbi:DUF1934 domain-containing protein [Leuconostocaceae bacterium ESL0958]|nr:DUF1934 domain-containing protein [Leuconostocaceae bacterium ESL0958]